jgi:hypothetical protein
MAEQHRCSVHARPPESAAAPPPRASASAYRARFGQIRYRCGRVRRSARCCPELEHRAGQGPASGTLIHARSSAAAGARSARPQASLPSPAHGPGSLASRLALQRVARVRLGRAGPAGVPWASRLGPAGPELVGASFRAGQTRPAARQLLGHSLAFEDSAIIVGHTLAGAAGPAEARGARRANSPKLTNMPGGWRRENAFAMGETAQAPRVRFQGCEARGASAAQQLRHSRP